jgi:diaminopimelate epimerase
VLPPDEGPRNLTAELVQALCDRRRGIGADGVLQVVAADQVEHGDPDVRWFMDYRNADGSVAEMCGNGIRVFARYLVSAGHEPPGRLHIATRAGIKAVDVGESGDVCVDMGLAQRLTDAKVVIAGTPYDARGWSLGNPHLVVLDAGNPAKFDLTRAPVVEPADAYPLGVNVEIVQRQGPEHVRMRVYERGVGETRSCGTGACAAAVAAMDAAGKRGSYVVDVPGGRLVVEWRADDTVLLSGPAVLVAEGDVDLAVAE